MDKYHEILNKYWGYTSFRPLQEEIIHSVGKGRDTLGLMPTGGGKSLTFQVPAMTMNGICLVVTPLIALMKDQVDNLKSRNIKALAVYSGMSYREILTTLENAILGDYKFLYVSPERLATELFLSKLKDMNVCFLVVDEAHCISQWGYDFRPSYLNIANIREYLPNVPVLALTATATPDVVDDIQDKLHFKEKNVFRKSFERKNLDYSVQFSENKTDSLCRILADIRGSSIVYVRSRQKTKEIAADLFKNGFTADFYHAGLNDADKTRKQNAWKNGECRVIVSTNAFGMGIDKPDVRSVIHLDLPNSVEEYFQEAGRAGRDEQESFAVILYNKNDSTKLKKRISDEFPERDMIVKVYEHLAYYLQIAEGYGMGTVYDFNLQEFCYAYKLPLMQAHSALKILDLAGYIEYTEEVENRSRLMITVYREELYQYDFDADTDQLINTVLRLYTGVFTDYAYIDEALIAVRLNKNRQEIYEALKSLSKRKIIDYIPHKKTPFIIYKQPRTDTKYLHISKDVYELRKKRFSKRIESMIEYVERDDVCRSRMLLTYFGEKNISDCGHCDVCLNRSKIAITAELFQEIFGKIQSLLKERQALDIKEITERLSPYHDEQTVIKVIRFQLDEGQMILEYDKLKLP
ncbi:MAG: ATP-dependent DNA helicase RecQ [Dysgonomonas sp.]